MGKLAVIGATRTGKLLIAFWLLALIIFIALPVVGAFQGELLGNLSFSVLPVAILLNVSIILAHYVQSGSVRIAKLAWIGIAVVVLLITLYAFDGKADSDIWVVLTWSMLVLSFPASLLVSVARMLLSMEIQTSYVSLAIEWAAYFILGYWQWFVLLPWLWRKWKTRRVAGASSSL